MEALSCEFQTTELEWNSQGSKKCNTDRNNHSCATGSHNVQDCVMKSLLNKISKNTDYYHLCFISCFIRMIVIIIIRQLTLLVGKIMEMS